MKTFNNYVNEQLEDSNEKSTANNKERKAELEKWLKGKKLPDYVATLNKMLEDPKAKALLEEGFGGSLGDTQLKFSEVNLPVTSLRPTQSEIDVAKSIDYPLTKPENIDNVYKNGGKGVQIIFPLITFRKNYVIDGHHRWSQIFAINPDARVACFNYDGDISPIQMLKATQGAIAAVKAEDNKNDGAIPSEQVEGKNLFDDKWDKDAIIKHIKDTAVDGVPTHLSKFHKELKDIDSCAEWITENLLNLKSNNYPEDKNINRGIMPQTDKGGTDKDNPKSSLPDEEGSALNKLKDDEFVKGAVQ